MMLYACTYVCAGGDKESRLTSTLRRLSTARKKGTKVSKKKEKDVSKDLCVEDSAATAAVGGCTSSNGGSANRPSSTTSRESEAEGATSGYIR